MKSTITLLVKQAQAKFDWKAFKHMEGQTLDQLISQLKPLFIDSLFNYSIEKKQVKSANELPEAFIVADINPVYVQRVGVKLVNDKHEEVEASSLVNKEIVFIESYPKILDTKSFVELIYQLFPKANFFLLAAVPFILIPAFYSNLFNTRLIHNSQVSTLVYVTTAFIILWGCEYTLKHFIKHTHLRNVEKSSLKIERYLLSIMPSFKQKDCLTKIRMVESNRKVIWDHLPSLLMDGTSFLLVMLLLFLFIGSYALGLFGFYMVIIAASTYMRYRNYKVFLEVEAAQQDLLNERISYYRNNKQLRFLNNESLLNNFEQSCKKSFSSDHSLASFNFNWDEFVRISSFLASFGLFIVLFYTSKFDTSIFNVLFALLILNGRAASSVISFVTKVFFVLISTHHLKLAVQDLFDNLEPKIVAKGLHIESINSISLKDVNINVDQSPLLLQVNLELTKGNIYGFFGQIGSGKSTLMSTIVQSHSEYSGTILFNNFYNGVDIDPHVFSTQVVFLDPSSEFIRGSLYSNFYMRGVSDVNKITKICSLVFTHATIDYEFIFLKDISQIPMSTGQKRKLLILMSVDPDKRLIILDEALSNLAAADVSALLQYIKQEAPQAILLIVSHDKALLNQLPNLFEIKDQRLIKHKNSIVKIK
ncbi:ATP-binding cassette domain-containing protein [Vibrio sp. TH_r3]|uniref:ATP-binding cassette domain-containing protein n=1 Tax=Vibrio sp. TH_r3 TaxID=3082084 RepID=UPI0029551B09|nr:ATP-binding cassette domain-containing protein [Vibrio sp. TH_r3]MDV7106330.1 ATP-binding cassette domain-containing protein [Vibrio sp. TH_r3]